MEFLCLLISPKGTITLTWAGLTRVHLLCSQLNCSLFCAGQRVSWLLAVVPAIPTGWDPAGQRLCLIYLWISSHLSRSVTSKNLCHDCRDLFNGSQAWDQTPTQILNMLHSVPAVHTVLLFVSLGMNEEPHTPCCPKSQKEARPWPSIFQSLAG